MVKVRFNCSRCQTISDICEESDVCIQNHFCKDCYLDVIEEGIKEKIKEYNDFVRKHNIQRFYLGLTTEGL